MFAFSSLTKCIRPRSGLVGWFIFFCLQLKAEIMGLLAESIMTLKSIPETSARRLVECK